MTDTTQIALSETDFRNLVAGKVVTLSASSYSPRGHIVRGQTVEIILSDIGFDRIQAAVDDARDASDT